MSAPDATPARGVCVDCGAPIKGAHWRTPSPSGVILQHGSNTECMQALTAERDALAQRVAALERRAERYRLAWQERGDEITRLTDGRATPTPETTDA